MSSYFGSLLGQAQAVKPSSGWFLVFYLASPLLAPLITIGVGGWWLQRSFVSRANASAFADSLVKRMDDLQSDSLEYWNLDLQQTASEARARVLEQKIKGSLRTLGSDFRFFRIRYAKHEKFEPLIEDIFDACTGGGFETTTRTVDSKRYLTIVNSVNALKSLLLQVKL
jgi:hypothetical protein